MSSCESGAIFCLWDIKHEKKVQQFPEEWDVLRSTIHHNLVNIPCYL